MQTDSWAHKLCTEYMGIECLRTRLNEGNVHGYGKQCKRHVYLHLLADAHWHSLEFTQMCTYAHS